jgi:LPS-assembly protein
LLPLLMRYWSQFFRGWSGGSAMLLAFALTLPAQPEAAGLDPAMITADELNIDFASQTAVYRGNARAEFQDVVFLADEIRWHRPSQTATASGDTVLQRGDLRLIAEQLTYELASQTYRLREVRLGRDPYFFSGDTVAGDANEITFTDAALSYGEPNAWAPTLRAKTLTYDPVNQRIRTTGGRVGMGPLTWLPLPGVSLPLGGPDLFEITFDGGASNRLGLFGRIGATVPIGEVWRAGADVGIYTNRGVMAGPALGYDQIGEDGTAVFGRFTSGYIRDSGDQGDLGVDNLGRPIDPDRGVISWEHRQTITPSLSFNAELNYWSDSEVLRDFRPGDFFPVQVPDTFAELNYHRGNTVAGAFIRAQPNDFQVIRERLPELTWELLPSPVSHGIIQQAQSSFVGLREDPIGGAANLSTSRFDAYYGLSRPWSPAEWFTFNPIAAARVTHYTDAVGGKSAYTRTLSEVGFDAALRFAGTFETQNKRWGIDGLRHLITPRISYRFIDDADKGAAFIPPIDRRVFATYLEPLSLGSRRQIDDLTATNNVRLSVDQRLQTRDIDYGSRDLVHLNLAIDSRFDSAPNARTLSALHSELRLSPAPFLDFELYHRATPGDWTMRELNTAITLHNADQWELQVASHYLESDIQEFIGSFAYRFNEVWQGYTRLHFDARRDRFVEQTYGMRQTIANRWAIGYEISFFEGQRREADFGFALRFDAVTF